MLGYYHDNDTYYMSSSETQGQIVERGKVRMGKKKVGEEKSKAKREAPGENVFPE